MHTHQQAQCSPECIHLQQHRLQTRSRPAARLAHNNKRKQVTVAVANFDEGLLDNAGLFGPSTSGKRGGQAGQKEEVPSLAEVPLETEVCLCCHCWCNQCCTASTNASSWQTLPVMWCLGQLLSLLNSPHEQLSRPHTAACQGCPSVYTSKPARQTLAAGCAPPAQQDQAAAARVAACPVCCMPTCPNPAAPCRLTWTTAL